MKNEELLESILTGIKHPAMAALFEDAAGSDADGEKKSFKDVVNSKPDTENFKADESSPYTWGSHEFEGSDHYVFLGGTCSTSTWREHVCDYLTEHKISYFQPQSNNWNSDMAKAEDKAKDMADVQLFVLTPAMTGFYSLVEILEMIMKCNAGRLKPESLRIGIIGDLANVKGDEQMQRGIKKTVVDILGDKLPKPSGLVIAHLDREDDKEGLAKLINLH